MAKCCINVTSRFASGVRANAEFIDLMVIADVEYYGRDYRQNGQPIHLVEWPTQFRCGNCHSNEVRV